MYDCKAGAWEFDWNKYTPAGLAESLAMAEFRATAKSFGSNAQRILALSGLPDIIFGDGVLYGRAEATANIHILGETTPRLTVSGEPRDTKLNERIELLAAILRGDVPENLKVVRTVLFTGLAFGSMSDYFRSVFPILMEMQLVGAWTTFEALAGDLWAECLNARPQLGFVALNSEPAPEDDERERERKRKLKLGIPIWLVKQWNFDLRGKMGTLLRNMGKWDFSRRGEMADAYLKVFGQSSEPQLKAIFEDKHLRWLAAVRNVIVHRAGRADDDFIKQAKNHPRLGAVEYGQAVPVDGELCTELVGAVLDRCVELLRFVDGQAAALT